jgi:L-seryl-tRNA(Ser) seleniumtransferase
MPYMMMPEDHKIASQALYAVLSKPPKFENPVRPSGEPSTVAGNWDLRIDFALGSASHKLTIIQSGKTLTGFHEGETVGGDVHGVIYGNQAHFQSHHPIQGTAISYHFTGVADGDRMSGELNMGEYGPAKWTAMRRG